MANNKIQIKRTTVSGRTANTTNASNAAFIDKGELAVNLADRKIFSSDAANTLFEVGSNLTSLSVTSSVTLDNDVSLRFKTLSGNSVGFRQQSDDNFVFFTSNTAGGERPVFAIYANTLSSNLSVLVSTVFNTNVYIGALSANGSLGTSGQVLTSNGSQVYWSSPATPTGTNVNATFAWTNTHSFAANVTFGNNISLNSGNSTVGGGVLLLAGIADPNWKIGRNTNSTTKWYYTNNSLDIMAANTNLEGIVLGNPLAGGRSYLETGHDGTFITGNVTIGNTSSKSTINSTAFSGTANNSTNFGGLSLATVQGQITSNAATAYSNGVSYTDTKIGTANTAMVANAGAAYTNAITIAANATNLTSGTVAFARLPSVDSISNTSITLVPVANNVKTAYDAAITANTNAQTALTAAGTAYTNAIAIAANGSNITSGTVAFARLPALYLGTTAIQSTSAAQALSGITTLAAGNTTVTGFANVTTTIQGGSSLTIAGALSGVTTAAMGNTTITGFANVTSTIQGGSSLTIAGAASGITTLAAGNTTITGFANVSSTLAVAGITTFSGNVVLGSVGLSSNGGFGSAGQVLHSNGTATYWAADDGITSIATANGLSGGTITSTGTLGVTTGSTLTVNTTGIHVNSDLSINSLVLAGNLTVSGTRTYVNTTTLDVGDNIITLNADLGAVAPSENAGIEIMRGTSANVQFIWDETNDRWSTNAQPLAVSSLIPSANIVLGSAGLSANGALGTAGQVLHSNGSATYWAADDGITSIATANGLTGGTITSTGTLGVASGSTLTVNSTGIHVNSALAITSLALSGGLSGVTTAAMGNTTITGFANVTSTLQVGGVSTFSGNVILGTSGVSANGSFGTSGQLLTSNGTSVYWANASSGVNAVQSTYTYTLAANTTLIQGIDDNAAILSYTTGLESVFINGVRQIPVVDYTTTNATAITLTSNAIAGEVVQVTTWVGQVNTTNVNATFAWTNTHSFSNTVTFGAISANGSLGTAGQVLHSNGSATYWAADDNSGTVTSIATSNGISGGTITSTGTIGVTTGSTLSVNSTGIHVNSALSITSLALSGALSGVTTAAVGNTTITGFANVTSTLQVGNNIFVSGGGDLILSSATGGANSSIFNDAADLYFNANGATRQYIASNGNIGIGITNPQQLLAVGNSTDQVGAGVSGAVTTLYFGSPSNGSGGIKRIAYDRTTGNLNFIGNSVASPSTQMTLDSSGNLGVGTSSLTARFAVNGGTGTSQTRFEVSTTEVQEVATNAAQSAYANRLADAAQHIWKISGTERMRVDATGNIGIGTTGPGYRLDVASADTTAGLGYAMRLRSNATANAAALQFTNSGVTAQNGLVACTDAGVLIMQADSASAALAFRTNGDERFRINASGGITSSNLADAVGYKGLPQNQQTSAYTLAFADQGDHVYATAGAFAITVPANATTAFPIGTAITIVVEDAAKTVVPAAGVTLILAGTGAATTGTRTMAIGSVATLLKVGTNRWYISGAGVT